MPDAGSSRAVRWSGDVEHRRPNGASHDSAQSIVHSVARSHRAAAISTLHARTLATKSHSVTHAIRDAAYVSAGAGCVGVVFIGSVVIPDVWRHGYLIMLSIPGIIFCLIPITYIIVWLSSNKSDEAARLSMLSTQAMVLSTISKNLTQMFINMGDYPNDDTYHSACSLLILIENEIETIGIDELRVHDATAGRRRHKRVVPRQRRVVVKTADGRNLIGFIADLSVSGVALKERLPCLDIGDEVEVGRHQAIVRRRGERSTAFEFKNTLDESTFGERTVL